MENSRDESTGWIGLLSLVFIYVGVEHYFAGWWDVSPGESGRGKGLRISIGADNVRSLAEGGIMDRMREVRMGSHEGSRM